MAGRGGYGVQSGAVDSSGTLITHDVIGPGNNSNGQITIGKIVGDSQDDAISKLAGELNMKLDSSTRDYLTQYYLNEQSSKNAYHRELDASSTQYQRAVKDLQAAGINPFLAFDSLRSSAVSSTAGNVSGGLITQKKNAQREAGVNALKATLTVIGIIAAAVIGAML